jgi:two-component system cell cycle response regulator
LVVDDSPSIRSWLSMRLRTQGYEVDEAPDGETGADKAVAEVPDVVVTDLHMNGMSGVQLCRIVRSEPTTAHIPVVLLTASGDKRSRFWARSAGAAAYVSKDQVEELVKLLPGLLAESAAKEPAATAGPAVGQAGPAGPGPALRPKGENGSAAQAGTKDRPSPQRRGWHERMSAILDAAFFESVIAGEVRTLASFGGHAPLFEGLVTLMSDILTYRWMGLVPSRAYAPLFVHAHPDEAAAIEALARAALGVPTDRTVTIVSDTRAFSSTGAVVETMPIVFGSTEVGCLAVAPTPRGFSRDDKRTLSLVAGELGGPLQMSGLYEDSQRMASLDALTGLPNRRAFLDVVERERARSERHALPFSLMLLDIDHFKAVNDNRGHRAGDAVLQGVSRVMMSVARRSDVVARWGGEEFVVALPQTGEAGARVAAERMRRAIAAASHPCPEGEAIRITASIGVSSAESPWRLETLISEADAAMYAAKARGRNRVEATASLKSIVRTLEKVGG